MIIISCKWHHVDPAAVRAHGSVVTIVLTWFSFTFLCCKGHCQSSVLSHPANATGPEVSRCVVYRAARKISTLGSLWFRIGHRLFFNAFKRFIDLFKPPPFSQSGGLRRSVGADFLYRSYKPT